MNLYFRQYISADKIQQYIEWVIEIINWKCGAKDVGLTAFRRVGKALTSTFELISKSEARAHHHAIGGHALHIPRSVLA